MTDQELESKIEGLKRAIQKWAESYGIWTDSGFLTWDEYRDDEPEENPVVLIMWTEGPLCDLLNGYSEYDGDLLDDFRELVDSEGFIYEMIDNVSISFYTEDEELAESYRNYFEWKWVCKLITPDYSDLYEEIFLRFTQKPSDLHRLDPRKFEILIDSIFRNNGFRTELGPGRADEGVDIRLYTNDVIGEAVTLVQVKRYAPKNPIELQAVQALSAAVTDERANRGLFVTTSRYLPVAKRFAARQSNLIKLATSTDIVNWSQEAAVKIIRDKSELVSNSNLLTVVDEIQRSGIIGKIFQAKIGYKIVNNDFILILKQTKRAALVLSLPKKVVTDFGLAQSGNHVPIIDMSLLNTLNKNNVFRVKMDYTEDGDITLWGRGNLYSQWNGLPQHFDYWD